jgi:hypothetical protein
LQGASFEQPYQASGAFAHAARLAGGVAIGAIIVLLFWLMVG